MRKIWKTQREKNIATLMTISICKLKYMEGSKIKANQENGIRIEWHLWDEKLFWRR